MELVLMPYLLPLLLLFPLSLCLIFFIGKKGSGDLGENHVDFTLIQTCDLLVGRELLPEFVESNLEDVFCKIKYEVLIPESLNQRKYVLVMDEVARGLLDEGWRPDSVVEVVPWARKYSFELSCRLFMNLVDPVLIDQLLEPFLVLSSGMMSMPINRTAKGGRMVRLQMLQIIKKRRDELMKEKTSSTHGRQEQDILSKMLLLTGEDSKYDSKIANFFVVLLLGSYETTSSSLIAVINFLAQLPHIYQGVLKEQMEIAKSKGPNELLTWEDLAKMKYSWNVARESLRLIPPTTGAFKEAIAELSCAGFTIPKGWKKFDPSGRGPLPYSFLPFGGGTPPTVCRPGREYYGKEAILVFMHNVVTRFRLEKTISNEKIDLVQC